MFAEATAGIDEGPQWIAEPIHVVELSLDSSAAGLSYGLGQVRETSKAEVVAPNNSGIYTITMRF